MGYQTEFKGSFKLNKPLDAELFAYLNKFATTRRMARCLDSQFGVEGEFFVDGEGFMGQAVDYKVIDSNRPPSTQPSLWCQWVPNQDGTAIVWDEGEKFYHYKEWILYIIQNFLHPNGYTLNGKVSYEGEDGDDYGTLIIANNVLYDMVGDSKVLNLFEPKKCRPQIDLIIENTMLIDSENSV